MAVAQVVPVKPNDYITEIIVIFAGRLLQRSGPNPTPGKPFRAEYVQLEAGRDHHNGRGQCLCCERRQGIPAGYGSKLYQERLELQCDLREKDSE